MYKSPYKWIDSLVRNSHNFIHLADISFERNHTPLKIISDIPDDTFKNRKQHIVSLEKLCLHYNSYFYFWFEWVKQLEHHHFIKYEDLLFKTENILKHICEKNDFELINNEFYFDRVTNSKKFTNSHKEYYNKSNVFMNLNANHLKVINKVIDKKILERLNIDAID